MMNRTRIPDITKIMENTRIMNIIKNGTKIMDKTIMEKQGSWTKQGS